MRETQRTAVKTAVMTIDRLRRKNIGQAKHYRKDVPITLANSGAVSPPFQSPAGGVGDATLPTFSQHDRNAEARIQAAIVEWIRWVAPQVKVFHVPNGGLRGKREAAKLKWMGVLPGVPDLVIISRDGVVRFMEIKTYTGNLSPEQKEFWEWCIANNVPNCICRSIDDARRVLSFWKIETREAMPAGQPVITDFSNGVPLRA